MLTSEELLNQLHQETENFSVKFVLDKQGKLESYKTWGDIIYHYTGSLSAVEGIIKYNELWATNLAYVNDAREIKIGIDRFIKVCTQLQTSLNPQNIDYQILDELKAKITNKNTTSKYSCSFTSEGDLLSQWRGYTYNGKGYSIGFKTKELRNMLQKYGVRSSQIRYEEKEQLIWVEAFLKGYIQAINNYPNSIIQLNKSAILNELECQVEEYSVTFKDVGFSEEKEVRFHLSPNNTYKVETRMGNGIFIPIIKLKIIDDQKLPIEKIIISPLLDYPKTEQGLRILLDNAGHHDVSIERSQIPFQL